MKLKQLLEIIKNIRVLERDQFDRITYIFNCNDLNLKLGIINDEKIEYVDFGWRHNINFSNIEFKNKITPFLEMKVAKFLGINDIGGSYISGQTLEVIVVDKPSDEKVAVKDMFDVMNQFKITYFKGVIKRSQTSVSYSTWHSAFLSHNIALEFYVQNAEKK